MIHGLTTLGSGADLVVVLIIAGFFLISRFIKMIRQIAGASGGQAGNAGGSSNQARMAELAQRRRQELERLTQDQRPTAPTTMAERPANLSLPEYAARLQAKTLYERRAEALRRQREFAQAKASIAPPPQRRPPPFRPAPRPTRPSMPARVAPRPAQPVPPPRPAPPRQAVSPLASADAIGRRAQDLAQDVKQGVANQDAAAAKEMGSPADAAQATDVHASSQHALALRKILTGPSARAAMVLKELLDAPVGLRTQDEVGRGF